MSNNVLQETLREVYPEFSKTANGWYGNSIVNLLDEVFRDCALENPVGDVDFQMTMMIRDLEDLQTKLMDAVYTKLNRESAEKV